MKIIGITGGIGSGKSIICEVFKSLGISIYNADNESKKLVNSDVRIIKKLKKNFGENIYNDENYLNKTKLADLVFNDKNALEKLNSIIHPIVKLHFAEWVLQKKEQNINYVLKESAILIETGTYKNLDKIITVYASEDIRIHRVMKRDITNKNHVMSRISKQMKDEEKIKYADFIIYNDNKKLLLPQILKLHQIFNE